MGVDLEFLNCLCIVFISKLFVYIEYFFTYLTGLLIVICLLILLNIPPLKITLSSKSYQNSKRFSLEINMGSIIQHNVNNKDWEYLGNNAATSSIWIDILG